MREIFYCIVIIVLLILGMYLFLDSVATGVDKDCKAKFGQEWSGRYGPYYGSRCVNSTGEAKYL